MTRRFLITCVFVVLSSFPIVNGNATHDEKIVAPPELVDSRLLTDVFPPDPEGVWRRIGVYGSTSKCIGDPVTPLCAIETSFACFIRVNHEYCDIAWGSNDTKPFRNQPDSRYYYVYRVVSVRRATQKDIDADPARFHARRPGDILVDLERRPCRHAPGDHHCTVYDKPFTYTLRYVKGGWRIVHIFGPRWGNPRQIR